MFGSQRGAGLGALAAALALVAPSRAALAGEDELIVAVEPGYATLVGPVRHGAGVDGSAWVGTASPFWLAGSLGVSGHFGEGDPVIGRALVGLVYALDVFAAIPFLEAQGGLIWGEEDLQPTARLGLGLDYLVTRTVSVGLVGRVTPIGEPLGDGLFSGHIRVAVRLEY